MRTTLYVDRELLEEAMRLAGTKKMTAAVNLALHEFIRRRRLENLAAKLGKEDFRLNLDELEEMRRDG